MSQTSVKPSSTSERLVRDIRRATRRQYSAEEKIRIVLDGLRGEASIAELCRREGIAESMYYRIPEITDEDKKSGGPPAKRAKNEKTGSGTGMDKGAMKMVLAKAKRAPVNCATGLSKDGRFGLLLMHISRKPKALVADLIDGARDIRWGTAAVDVKTDPKLVMFQPNKSLAGLDRKLRKTLKVAGYTKAELANRSTGGDGR